MSSATDPQANKQAGEPATDEPSSKKAKLDDTKAIDANNGTVANDEKANLENNNGAKSGSGGSTNKTLVKTVNGNEKSESTAKEAGEEEFDGDGDDSGNLDAVFDPKVAKALEQVENIQSEICNLNEKASEDILKVEQKYNKLRRPFFEKRNELLKVIPNFWLTSLANHPIIAPMIETSEDEDCLHYMVNLDIEECEDIKSGYKLKLYFVENPYITNEFIVKEFRLSNSEDDLSPATPIEYKNTPQGKNLKRVVENSIAQNRRSRARPGAQTQQSFFGWLVEQTETPGGPDEIAEILKDQIWPNPLEFFFAAPEEYADDESDDEDEEIDDEDIDDEEDGVITEGIDFSDEELEGEEGEGEDDDDDEDDDEEGVE